MATIIEFPGLRPPDAEPSDVELDVLRFVAEGFGPREIGRRLFLPDRTVDRRLRGVVEALHARSLAQAVAIAIRRGLID